MRSAFSAFMNLKSGVKSIPMQDHGCKLATLQWQPLQLTQTLERFGAARVKDDRKAENRWQPEIQDDRLPVWM